MKHNKAVYVTLKDIKVNLDREYNVHTERTVNNEGAYLKRNHERSKNFACQYDSNRDAVLCTCKRVKGDEYRYYNTSHQVYRSHGYSKGFTDVGVGSVKTVQRKRVRRIYLTGTEDRGVGSSDLTYFIRRANNGPSCYYSHKKTSSKCVGGVMEYQNTRVLNEKLSPIYKTKSGSTSPKRASFEENTNNNHFIIPDPVVNLGIGKKRIRSDKINKEQAAILPRESQYYTKPTYTTHADKKNDIRSVPAVSEEKDFSSDSLVQHVHNLQNSSSFKPSKTSIDMIENKLEREYIRMFSTTSKHDKPVAEVHPVRDCTSASLRKRLDEALRRGLIKKHVSREHGIEIKSSSQNSTPSRKDVSITSDPPSLEARSYTNTKKYSPIPSHLYHKYEDVPQTSYKNSVTGKKRSSHGSIHAVDSDCQDVKGMFKLWGKKFDLEEDCYTKTSPYTTPDETTKQKKKVELILPEEEAIETQKKEGKRFSFFKRKKRKKEKQPYKSKKGVTAGRCEVGDGLTIKIGAANQYTPEAPRIKSEQIRDEYSDMLRKAWLKRCLDDKNSSMNSVKIRWNNEMYATSSSTVFELMECIYKNTGIVFTSTSDGTTISVPTTTATVETPHHHSHKTPQVTFMEQSIQAWMMPKLITDKFIDIQKKKTDIRVTFSNQKWFIDKSKAFSHRIELVLHSENFVNDDVAKSSEYIVIDIPKGYFLETSSEDEQGQSSDEQVYNIVEYETAKSSSYLKKKINDHKMDTGDHETETVTVKVKQSEDKETNIHETAIQTPLLHRDVVVQGSNVYVPKRCDVISVGIITQHTQNRDVKDIEKPVLKMQDVITDDDSAHALPPPKKCELAESYLQDYYRHCIPLGMDLYSWFISDSNLRASSDNNSLNSLNNQGDCSKSCPNMYDDYQPPVLVSSCTTSSHSQGMVAVETKADETTATYYNKFKKKSDDPHGKRVLPKDSLEVFKRRKIYATNNVKAEWCKNQESEPLSKPSILDKFAQNSSKENELITCDPENPKTKKHVSLKDAAQKMGEGILSFKRSVGCSICKKREPCTKHTRIIPEPMCEITELQPPCLESCTKEEKPPCSKQGSPTCLVPPPPICPEGPPSPCQPACPPIPPPCASYLEGSPPTSQIPTSPPRSTHRSFSRFLSRRTKSSPPSSQKKSSSPPHSPPRSSKPRLFSRFLSRRSKQKPCKDSCSKLEKPPSPTKLSSPCASFTEANPSSPTRSPCTSPLHSPHVSPQGSKTRSFSIFPRSSTEKPPSKDSCSKIEKPPCSINDSSPNTSSPKASSLSPPRSPRASPKNSKTSSFSRFPKSSTQTPPCKDSCSKLDNPPCARKDSPNRSPPTHPSPPHHKKITSSSSQQKRPCIEPCAKEKTPSPPLTGGSYCGTKSASPRSPQKQALKKITCSPPQSTQLCGCNSKKSCGLPQCLTSNKLQSYSQEFPWPLKNQSPNDSVVSLKQSPSNKSPATNSAKKCNSLTNKEKGDCDPHCPRKSTERIKERTEPYMPPICPLPFNQLSSAKARSQSKISGVHLKKMPMPQNISDPSKRHCKVIRLNSKENLTIRMKPQTPSTEEIRGGCNIKVLDEDGQTLYERQEYKADTAQARKHLVQDTYRDSRINRVTTSKADIMAEKNLESCESNTSLHNIIEINFNLKFKQVDKTTDIDVKNCSDAPKDNQNENVSSQDIYVVQDKTKQSTDLIEDEEKRDINIKIIIKNYQQNPKNSKVKAKHPKLQADDEFTRKISEKFHTVSTGYSDDLDKQTYSIHRATVNFTESAETNKHLIYPSIELVKGQLTEKVPINSINNECASKHSKIENSISLVTTNKTEKVESLNPSIEFVKGQLTEKVPINLINDECATKHSKIEHSISLVTTNKTEKVESQMLPNSISQIKCSKTHSENNETKTISKKSATSISATDNEEPLFSDVQHSNIKIPKIRDKEEKKKMLKLIFEDSINSTNTPNKSKMQSVQKMVLPSSSSGFDHDSVKHECSKELTYESLKPNLFKNSDSMKNYYQYDSSISDQRPSDEEILYPTAINNSSDSAESRNEDRNCLCSDLAAKLNICGNNNFKACCCRGNAKRDEEIDCDLTKDVITKTIDNYVDVETQDSLKDIDKKSGVTIGSNTVVQAQMKAKKYRKLFSKIPKRLFSYSSTVKLCELNTKTILGLSDEDKVIVLNSDSDDSKHEKDACDARKSNELKPIDIFQLYETKKAVLEIYAEGPISDDQKHVVAKLPKFIYSTESEICNYEDMFTDFREFSARNVVRMSTTR